MTTIFKSSSTIKSLQNIRQPYQSTNLLVKFKQQKWAHKLQYSNQLYKNSNYKNPDNKTSTFSSTLLSWQNYRHFSVFINFAVCVNVFDYQFSFSTCIVLLISGTLLLGTILCYFIYVPSFNSLYVSNYVAACPDSCWMH